MDRRALVGFALSLLCAAVGAQEQCTWYHATITETVGADGVVTVTGPPDVDTETAAENFLAQCTASNLNRAACTNNGCSKSWMDGGQLTCTPSIASWSGNNFTVNWVRVITDPGFPGYPGNTIQRTYGLASALDDCPEPDPCNASFPGVGDSFTSTTNPGSGASYCHALSSCKVTVSSTVTMGGETLYTWKHTNQSCESTVPSGGGSTEDGEQCITASGSGVEYCSSGPRTGSDRNCGFLNGGFVCFQSTETDGCQVFGDGGRACGSSAPTPPAPDNGTPGVRATPDQVINVTNNSNVSNFNYFNSTTVAGSARPPGTSGDNPYDGRDDGNGAGGVDSGGEGSGLDDDGCTEADGCTGTTPSLDEPECTFQSCTEQFFARVQESPIASSVLLASTSWPSGSCPTWTLELFGEEYSLSGPMCDIWEAVAPILSAVCLLMWAWVSTRIVLSA